jgi:hypothetical protein
MGFCSRKYDKKKCFTSCTAQSELPQIFDDLRTEEQEVAELGRQANVEVAINGDENIPTCDNLMEIGNKIYIKRLRIKVKKTLQTLL